jgi:hypothetical protein
VLQQSGLTHLFLKERAVDGGERFDRDKEVGSGGAPSRAVLGEATPRDAIVDMGVILQWSAPSVQAPGEPREGCPDEALVCGQPLEGRCRRLKQGLVRAALMRADEGTQNFRDGEGEEEMPPRELFGQVVLEPLLGFMLLTLGTVAVATGMIDAVVPPTVWALIAAVSVVAALTVLDGADDLAMRQGEVGVTLQVLRGKGSEDIAQGGHGRSPCMRASTCRRLHALCG